MASSQMVNRCHGYSILFSRSLQRNQMPTIINYSNFRVIYGWTEDSRQLAYKCRIMPDAYPVSHCMDANLRFIRAWSTQKFIVSITGYSPTVRISFVIECGADCRKTWKQWEWIQTIQLRHYFGKNVSVSNENGIANTEPLTFAAIHFHCFTWPRVLLFSHFVMCGPATYSLLMLFILLLVIFSFGVSNVCRVNTEHYIWRVVRQHATSLASSSLANTLKSYSMVLRRRSSFDRDCT